MPSPAIMPQHFVAKWRGDMRKERSVAQEHFTDLCRLLGHDTPSDTRDGRLAFEAGVDKQRGRTPTWAKPTSRSSSTASRSRTRRC